MNRCAHPGSGTALEVCEHLLADLGGTKEYIYFWRRFTGRATEFQWLCESCGREGFATALYPICQIRADRLDDAGGVVMSIGLPEIREAPTAFGFTDTLVLEPGTLTEPAVAACPVERSSEPSWLVLLVNGEIIRLGGRDDPVDHIAAITQPLVPDVAIRSWLSGRLTVEESAHLAPLVIKADEQWKALDARDREGKGSFVVWSDATDEAVRNFHDLQSRARNDSGVIFRSDADGYFAALCTGKGPRRGVVVDLRTGDITMQLDHRSRYEVHSRFPIAFFDDDGRSLVIHATDRNRLDISDPSTGELLTSRGPTRYRRGEPEPAHYLDYFHAGLSVSPGSRFVAENGWVWHPNGVVRAWDLDRWLRRNRWEAEDGPSVRMFCWRGYFWDAPMSWLDDHTLAVYGYGDDDDWIIPAVRIFDVATGDELRWFPGPAGSLDSDGDYLFSWDETGTSVWDPIEGARVHHDPTLHPMAFHRPSRSFLSIGPDGSARVNQVAV